MRETRLSELSSLGTDYLDLAQAARFPDRARAVEAPSAAAALRKLRRLYRLELDGNAVPPWLSELRHLRVLKLRGVKVVPPVVFELPRLRELYLDGTSVKALDGLETSRSLETVSFSDTPLGDDEEAHAALIKRIRGATSLDFMTGVAIPRDTKKTKPPAGKALLRAIADDTLAPGADLRKAVMRGATIEDALVDWDLRGADLSGTTWRRCDFDIGANLGGADLSGATFEECCFDSTPFVKAKLTAVSFRRCSLDVDFTRADLREARLTELEPSPTLQLERANAAKMYLEVVVHGESELDVEGEGVDLRGAHVVFDVTKGRREELAKKKTSRIKWDETTLEDAKKDAATRIVYTPLAGPEAQKRGAKAGMAALVDDKGPHATSLGRIDASNAGLWVVAFDGAAAKAWTGAGEDGTGGDFERAMDVEDGAIKAGGHAGVVAQVGDHGWSYLWQIEGGIAVIDHWAHGHFVKMSEAARVAAVGARVAQLPQGKSRKLGRIQVTSGCLAVMLPYAKGDFTPKQLATAAKGPKALVVGGDRALVPVPNGVYEVLTSQLGPKGYEDELGQFFGIVRFVRAGDAKLGAKDPKGAKGATAARTGKARKQRARRFELVDGTSSKFWEISLDGASFTARYGKIGAEGQSTTKIWPSPDKARAEHDKLVAEKIRKGYRETK